jgi:hypothetical protein
MIMCVCQIFQFQTGAKLKWGCVEPLVHSNFLRLGKTAENRPVIISTAKHRPLKLRPNNFQWFWNFRRLLHKLPLKVIAVESH